MTNLAEEGYMPAAEASAVCQRIFGISRPTFYRWLSEGRFDGERRDSVVRLGGRWYIQRDALSKPLSDGLADREFKIKPRRKQLRYHVVQTRTISEWSKSTGINYHTILSRLHHGWSTQRALTEPVKKR